MTGEGASPADFDGLVGRAVAHGGYSAEDLRVMLVPLWREVAAVHDEGYVAELRAGGALAVHDPLHLVLAVPPRPPSRNRRRLETVQATTQIGFDVVGHRRVELDLDSGSASSETLDVAGPDDEITRPIHVHGLDTWEHRIGHHDPVADIAVLGRVLASLALGLDLHTDEGSRRLVENLTNPFVAWPALHPMVARLIGEMVEPDRNRRAQDLASLADRLDSYRDQPVDFDLTLIDGAAAGSLTSRRAAIQTALRDRLFEINRRNRLVYFKPSAKTVNLTLGSVPLLLDVANLRADQLATWAEPLSDRIVAGKAVRLETVLRFEDAPYLPGALSGLIAQARRDRREYGIAQLRLVVCFLHWHNLKEARNERISSPLLLLPVDLTTKRGVRDSYTLQASTSEAEVNPALRHHLRQLYGIELPERWDLARHPVEELHDLVVAQVNSSEPGVAVELLDRPQLSMVQQRARMRVDQYKHRQQAARQRSKPSGKWSYRPGRRVPRGIQLFDAHVRYRPPSSLRLAAGAAPAPRQPGFSAAEPVAPESVEPEGAATPSAEVTTETSAYALEEAGGSNPYRWAVDLCSLTLASFNYRKMTLVRDYAELIGSDEPSDAFDRIFSLDARPVDGEIPDIPLAEQNLVVPADETQRRAIARARTGRSFIIQGPPGTGKSQTITNLIADEVARGERVLFVCEKRAAIDVVHARLASRGLDELCAVIHDSQADKKAFIHGMRSTYESWLADPTTADAVEAERSTLIATMTDRLDRLRRIDETMAATPTGSDRDLRHLYEWWVALRAAGAEADPAATTDASLPTVAAWAEFRGIVTEIADALVRLGEEPVLAAHPVSDVRAEVLDAPRPGDVLAERAAAVVDRVGAIRPALADLTELVDETPTIGGLRDLQRLLDAATSIAPQGRPALVPGSPEAARFQAEAAAMGEARRRVAEAGAHASGWRDPLSAEDAQAGLALAREKEGSALKVLSGPWRSLKRTIEARYDHSRHAVRPSITSLLESLLAWYQAAAALETLRAAAQATYGQPDIDHLAEPMAAVGAIESEPTVSIRRDAARIERAIAGQPDLGAALAAVDGLYDGIDHLSVDDLADRTVRLRGASGALRELVAHLHTLQQADPAVIAAVRDRHRRADEIEADVVTRAIDQVGLANIDVERFGGRDLARSLEELARSHRLLLDADARVIRARARDRFRHHVQVSDTSATQLPDADTKAFKKRYTAGRKALEHEFQKTMRYRSIRELASEPAGPVVMDLRPIWLMSPLSVSDTLPLDPDQFDVVIFDEASQIPLEDAIPSLYRSHQTIVVGDQMQLPPTTFFSSGRADDEDEIEADDGEGQRVAVVLDGDSFLAQSATSLPSTMLAWHYRSRSEELIGFSNAAFYGGALATVPDRHRPPEALTPIVTASEADPETSLDATLSRNISFHRLTDGVYDDRRNRPEATYIAEMVQVLLARDTGLTIGIAAFSEAQQGEIEEALARLAEDDPAFAAALEAEEQREDDGQHVGLFVKNLENVQGDERDLIIISVCYGPGPDGRMRMGFGPINQQGGEKRLNVIFSRARQHMAVVSTIVGAQITNEHNSGANALRRFLEYAEALSAGEHQRASLVLDTVNPLARRELDLAETSIVVDQMAAALRSRGLLVDVDHGRSRFRCDLAVRRPENADHEVAVLVDTAARTSRTGTEERALTHPAVLNAFGWQTLHVLTKDWGADPDQVITEVVEAIDAVHRVEDALPGVGDEGRSGEPGA